MEWNEPALAYEWIWQNWLGGVAVAPVAMFTGAALVVLNRVSNVFPVVITHFLCLVPLLVNPHKNCR